MSAKNSVLEKLDKELSLLSVNANRNLEDMPRQTQGAWAGAIREAKEGLKATQGKYKQALLRSAVGVFVEGPAPKVTELVDIVKAEGGIVVDALALYERFADAVEPAMSSQRMWGMQQDYILRKVLQEVMAELELTSISAPILSGEHAAPTHADVVVLARNAVRGSENGDTLNTLYLEAEIAKQALAIRYTGTTAPIFIVNAHSEDVAYLTKSFGKGVGFAKVAPDTVVDRTFLASVMKNLNKNSSPKLI